MTSRSSELADPGCVWDSSPLRAGAIRARSAFDQQFSPTTSFKSASTAVTIRGVGFFDYPHGQTGYAPNGRDTNIPASSSQQPSGTPANPGDSKNCGDFSTWSEAQHCSTATPTTATTPASTPTVTASLAKACPARRRRQSSSGSALHPLEDSVTAAPRTTCG